MSCSQLIDEPKNLIPKDKMSEIIAEFAMNEQIGNINPQTDMENATRFTLKNIKLKGSISARVINITPRQEI
jgi:hypothetical protein